MNLQQLEKALENTELQCYTAVRMARKHLKSGNYFTAMVTLKVDLDKFRCHDVVLAEYVMEFFK